MSSLTPPAGRSTIAPLGSAPLFAFATDGSMVWLRAAGPRLVAVDATSGETLREVELSPAPFGIAWHIERHGEIFLVRDDRELAGYLANTGGRIWKRRWVGKVAIGAAIAPGRHVSVNPSGDGIDVTLADLRAGSFHTKLRVDGTMEWIGANAAVSGDAVVFATDQREVYTVGLDDFTVRARHVLFGSRLLPPVVSAKGVHVAAIVERPYGGPVTRVSTLDTAGAIVSTEELTGEALSLSAGANGLVVEMWRGGAGVRERIAYRPDAPHVRLVAATPVGVQLRVETPTTEIVVPRVMPARVATEGRHDEVVPPMRDGTMAARSPRDGFLALLAMQAATSDVLAWLADAYESHSPVLSLLRQLGLTLRDPRVRWTVRRGRDPNLLDLAEHGTGDEIATYLYPPAGKGSLPIVRASDRTVTWVASDFDTFLAGFLHDRGRDAPDLVAGVLGALGLKDDFLRPLPPAMPPRWFFESHGARWSIADAEIALAAGDVEGAERMLVAAGRDDDAVAVKRLLIAVYDRLGWDHQRACVVETW